MPISTVFDFQGAKYIDAGLAAILGAIVGGLITLIGQAIQSQAR